MKQTLTNLLSTIMICTLACTMALGQAGTAQISGRGTDATGAVLPGVEVTLTQTGTGVARSAVTNEVGAYVFPSLAVGPYRLEAALPGFRTYLQFTDFCVRLEIERVVAGFSPRSDFQVEHSVRLERGLKPATTCWPAVSNEPTKSVRNAD